MNKNLYNTLQELSIDDLKTSLEAVKQLIESYKNIVPNNIIAPIQEQADTIQFVIEQKERQRKNENLCDIVADNRYNDLYNYYN